MQKVLNRNLRVLGLKQSKWRSSEKHAFGWFLKNFISVCSLCWWVVRDREKISGIPEKKNCQC